MMSSIGPVNLSHIRHSPLWDERIFRVWPERQRDGALHIGSDTDEEGDKLEERGNDEQEEVQSDEPRERENDDEDEEVHSDEPDEGQHNDGEAAEGDAAAADGSSDVDDSSIWAPEENGESDDDMTRDDESYDDDYDALWDGSPVARAVSNPRSTRSDPGASQGEARRRQGYYTEFSRIGFFQYGQSALGGSKSEAALRIHVTVVMEFLDWNNSEVERWANKLVPAAASVDFFAEMVLERAEALPDFLVYLDTKHLAPDTQRNKLCKLQFVATWIMCLQRADDGKRRAKSIDIQEFITNVKVLRTMLKQRAPVCKDVSTTVLPPGGLHQLQDAVAAVSERLQYQFQEINVEDFACSRATYDLLLSCIASMLYVNGVQGRKGALGKLTLSDGSKMASEGHAMSTQFKTRHTFGFQPVSVTTPDDHAILNLYLTK